MDRGPIYVANQYILYGFIQEVWYVPLFLGLTKPRSVSTTVVIVTSADRGLQASMLSGHHCGGQDRQLVLNEHRECPYPHLGALFWLSFCRMDFSVAPVLPMVQLPSLNANQNVNPAPA